MNTLPQADDLYPQPASNHATDNPPWDLMIQDGPVMTTAIHAGHIIRKSLQPWLEIENGDRLREEDPLTDYFMAGGDTVFRANRSRFEFDLNRPAETAVTVDPDDTWGLKIWNPDMPEAEKQTSLALHAEFYRLMAERVEAMIARHGRILVLDLHSYNHRRDGAEADAAPQAGNPDIDLGATTLDKAIYGDLLDRFADGLRSRKVVGKTPDVRVNVRWEDGGNFPEWLHAEYGDAACVITLEYKKIFMDEWSHGAEVLAMQDLRSGFHAAVREGRAALSRLEGFRP
ncbi:N-formylglutamate amidohydrolase [Altererythrobacter sp. SALINAS58]|uniref:N-formylglutamate amidohydrolase n=1 Tax=Alteripontixanthobacter muriae TaxID=2705546 RepID=UPI00157719B7|nr:N-formylglutamate amidohydrolase [Alteripontixanthobacter muriae]NTZ42161.1 N-formylglutamate amidohydrolase [Alteripontixanthobacter muriae]